MAEEANKVYGFERLDQWQEDVLKAEGNICICSGRQVGKSQTVAIKSSEYLIEHDNKTVLIISVTEDQAENLLIKILQYLTVNYPDQIDMTAGKKPTKHQINMVNGSKVITKAVGQYGVGVLGLTIDILVADECAYVPDAIWKSLTPMLLTTGGHQWLLSTPNAKSGYFYEAYTNPDMKFKTFHVNSEEVAKARPKILSEMMLEYLAREKARMTKLQYAQEYLAQFLEELGQFFPEKLIKETSTLQRDDSSSFVGEFFLGVDVARMGGDETTFEILERKQNTKGKSTYYHRDNIIHTYTLTTETIDKILELDEQYNFKRIYIDDGGLGVAVFDQLLIHEQTKRKVEAINNASRAVDNEKHRTKKLLKEDLYMNLLNMMEREQIKFLNEDTVAQSLRSITIEHNPATNDVRIYGRYSHIVEGLIRAAWSIRNTPLNIYFHSQ